MPKPKKINSSLDALIAEHGKTKGKQLYKLSQIKDLLGTTTYETVK